VNSDLTFLERLYGVFVDIGRKHGRQNVSKHAGGKVRKANWREARILRNKRAKAARRLCRKAGGG
jgi:hypothetical protein